MITESHAMETEHGAAHGSIGTYVAGFLVSIILTVGAYLVVTGGQYHGAEAVKIIMALAAIQLFVQLVFFLHLGKESKPRWNLAAFLFAVIVVVILGAGSLWIMKNLDYNMQMTPEEIIQDEGFGG